MFIRNGDNVIDIDGQEEYFDICPACGKEIQFEYEDFKGLVEENAIYSVQAYCDNECMPPKEVHKHKKQTKTTKEAENRGFFVLK